MTKTTKSSTAVCVFAYKRPQHLYSCLSALVNNNEAKHLDLRLYVDAPRHESDSIKHQEVLSICNMPWAFLSCKLIQRDVNLGLYKSLVGGISDTLRDYESTIVIEDDIQASPFLIRYLLDGLILYRDSAQVASIHGYTPPIIQQLPDTFFLRGADCWGWATWRDRWKLFRHDSAAMAREIRDRELVNEFNLNGNYDYLGMLEAHTAGLINSWAICWHASCFLANKLTLYPGRSFVKNIGLDGSGEHCEPSNLMNSEASQNPVRLDKIPFEVDPSVYKEYCNHFSNGGPYDSFVNRILRKIRSTLRQYLFQPQISKLSLIGPYESYEEASARASGYNSMAILDKVHKAVVDVLEGTYPYERDGSTFPDRPSIDNLRRVLIGHLNDGDSVIDFGGGLGGTFINNKDLFSDSIHYTIVEQPNFVEAGRDLFLKYNLKPQFVDSIFNAPLNPDIIIFSSVLQYIPNAEQILQKAAEFRPRLILIDRTALASDPSSERWWIQNEPSYYQLPISYPIRPLSLKTMLYSLKSYTVIEEWNNSFDYELPPHRGFLLSRGA